MQITIEGVVNSDIIQRGDRMTVELTPQLVGHLRKGLVKLVDVQQPSEPEVIPVETVQPSPEIVSPEPQKTVRKRAPKKVEPGADEAG